MDLIDTREPDAGTLEASERRLMGAILGFDPDDPAIEELHASGLRPSTVALLELLPLVELAWADGCVSPRERQLVAAAAARRREVPGSAHTQLAAWLTERPSERIFRASRNTLRRAMQDARATAERLRDTLETEITLLMSSAGGLLGGDTPAPEEQRRTVDYLFEELGLRSLSGRETSTV